MGIGTNISGESVPKRSIEMVQDLINHGGAVVSSADCHEIEIAEARVEGRFYTRADGFGFVRRTQEWIEATRVR